MNLEGKLIVVSGGAQGIGRVVVDTLLAKKARIAVLDKDGKALSQLEQALPEVKTICCDLTDAEQVKDAVDRIADECSVIDGLVNNAGLIYSQPLFNMMAPGDKKHSIEMWHKVINANLTSVFLATAHIVEKMAAKRSKGVIVNISSVAAAGNAGQTAYAAAKAGVNAMTATWAKELGVLGMRCVAIAPGFVDIASTRNAMTENVIGEWVRRTPLRRFGQPEDIAQTVVFAFENDFLTGTVLEVDGGLTI